MPRTPSTPSDGDRSRPGPADPVLSDYVNPMSQTGAVTEDKPVGPLVPRPAEVGKPILPKPPSFGISEGTRAELAEKGTARCPFTGRTLTAAECGVDYNGEEGSDGVSANASGLR